MLIFRTLWGLHASTIPSVMNYCYKLFFSSLTKESQSTFNNCQGVNWS